MAARRSANRFRRPTRRRGADRCLSGARAGKWRAADQVLLQGWRASEGQAIPGRWAATGDCLGRCRHRVQIQALSEVALTFEAVQTRSGSCCADHSLSRHLPPSSPGTSIHTLCLPACCLPAACVLLAALLAKSEAAQQPASLHARASSGRVRGAERKLVTIFTLGSLGKQCMITMDPCQRAHRMLSFRRESTAAAEL